LGRRSRWPVLSVMIFDQIIEELKSTLAVVRTGRASSALVEDLQVEAYGTKMKLKELAAIAVPEARQILITPWDKTVLEVVTKTLQITGFNPIVEGTALRLTFPPLTGEDRQRLMRQVGEKAEEARIKVRGVRREMMEEVEQRQRKKQISEDEAFFRKGEVEEEVKEANRQIEQLAQEKKKQLTL